jgi:hypothetical protein
MASNFPLTCFTLMYIFGLSWQQKTVYFTSGDKIISLNLSSSSDYQQSSVVSGLEDAAYIDYDPLAGRLYWVDRVTGTIKSSLTDGSQLQTVTSFDLSNPSGLAVDPIGGNVFFSDKEQRRISVMRTDGDHRRVLVWRDMQAPSSVQVDLTNGYVGCYEAIMCTIDCWYHDNPGTCSGWTVVLPQSLHGSSKPDWMAQRESLLLTSQQRPRTWTCL